VAHVAACRLVLAGGEVDRVLVVPTFKHPFAKELAPYEARVTMCEIAMRAIEGVEISRVEAELGGESRTLRTIEHLSATHADWHLRLVIGADILSETPKWYGFDAIARIAPPLVLGRVGVDAAAPPAVLPDVSSTEVRAAVARGDWEAAAALVPADVLAFIRERGLYGSAS
jgi:nicotinate-nucleotide adenylyltransferase